MRIPGPGSCFVWLLSACLLSSHISSGQPAAASAVTPATNDSEAHPLNIPIPLPIGETAKTIKIPEYGSVGQVLSLLQASAVKRLDQDHMQVQKMTIELYKPDGQLDFSINLPTSSFNVKTRMIVSIDPVEISSHDFVLSGDRLRFNTFTREGELVGKVRMRIFNLKAAGAPQTASP